VTDIVEYAVRGIPIGCVFALLAIGIVLTYKTSGVLNLAFGAQAYVSAALFYVLHDPSARNWPVVPAFLVAVVVAAPAIGWLLDRLLYRHLRTAPPLAKLVTSLGLLVAIPAIVRLPVLLGDGAKQRPPGLLPEAAHSLGFLTVDNNQLITIAITLLLVLGLTVLFRMTNLGLQMRAVVESPRMAELNGVNADRVGSFSWMLSSFFAGLAGVLISPLFNRVDDLQFFTLLVAALAAAAFGKLTSIPLTLAGGIALGVLQQVLTGTLPQGNVVSAGIRQALPFLVLFVLLLCWPGLGRSRAAADPLSGVDPPPPSPAARLRTRGLTVATRVFGVVVVGGGLFVALGVLNDYWLQLVTRGVVLSLVFLSITMITGLGGQISLCQAAFAAIGAFTTAQLVAKAGMSVLVAMVLGALVAAVVGAIVALPALRLGGIYLALATLAFAVMFENVIVPMEWLNGGSRGLRVPRPYILGIDFADDRKFLLLCVALLALVGGALVLVRSGTTGRFLDALRGSEVAATSIGINPARAKIGAFALSAAIAGFGGGLLASFDRQMSLTQYSSNLTFYVGLVWVVVVVSLGARSVYAATMAGLSFVLLPPLLTQFLQPVFGNQTPTIAASISFILFGLGAITYAKHPEGIIEAQTRQAVQRLTRRRSRSEPTGRSWGPVRTEAVSLGPQKVSEGQTT
jgi:branched-chain amino acid transport system permease protein